MGALFGGMLGAVVGSHRGLEPEVAKGYESHLSNGAYVFAVRVDRKDAPHTRGALIETGAFDVRDVEGNFIAKKAAASPTTTHVRELDLAH